MGLNINPNISSINTRNNISKTQELLRSSLSKLASGNRIVSAKDDAAGLAIGTRMDAEIASYTQHIRTATDSISMVRTAEGAQSEIADNLVRIRELSVQAGNGTLNESDRASIQQEIDGLVAEIDRISEDTEFNGQALLDGTFSMNVDVDGAEGIDVAIDDASAEALEIDDIDVTTPEGVQSAIDAVDNAINKVSESRANLGAINNRVESSIENIRTDLLNTAEARSRIMDADMAAETALLVQAQIKEQAGISTLGKINNLSPQSVLSLLS